MYRPTKPRSKSGQSALKRVVETFYEGSLEKAVASLLQVQDAKLSTDEAARLSKLVRDAKKKGQ